MPVRKSVSFSVGRYSRSVRAGDLVDHDGIADGHRRGAFFLWAGISIQTESSLYVWPIQEDTREKLTVLVAAQHHKVLTKVEARTDTKFGKTAAYVKSFISRSVAKHLSQRATGKLNVSHFARGGCP